MRIILDLYLSVNEYQSNGEKIIAELLDYQLKGNSSPNMNMASCQDIRHVHSNFTVYMTALLPYTIDTSFT